MKECNSNPPKSLPNLVVIREFYNYIENIHMHSISKSTSLQQMYFAMKEVHESASFLQNGTIAELFIPYISVTIATLLKFEKQYNYHTYTFMHRRQNWSGWSGHGRTILSRS